MLNREKFVNLLRLDEETEELHHDRVPLCLGKAIQQARQAKEWTQKDLSTVSCLNRRLGALQTTIIFLEMNTAEIPWLSSNYRSCCSTLLPSCSAVAFVFLWCVVSVCKHLMPPPNRLCCWARRLILRHCLFSGHQWEAASGVRIRKWKGCSESADPPENGTRSGGRCFTLTCNVWLRFFFPVQGLETSSVISTLF